MAIPDLTDLPLDEAVFVSLGYASGCWENLEGAGVFLSDDAKAMGDALIGYIEELANAEA